MIEFAFTSFLALLVIVDPVTVAAISVGVVGDVDAKTRRRTTDRAALIATIILILWGIGGQSLFQYLGVSIDALRIAGGIILFKLAFDMILVHRERYTQAEAEEAHTRQDVAIFPLAVPLLAGPGAFATLLVLVAQADGDWSELSIVFGALIVVMVVALIALRLAGPMTAVLGETGVNVITRVLGIVLAALAIQLVADGVLGYWPPA